MKIWTMLLGVAAVVGLIAGGLMAEDKKEEKEVTLKGKLVCGKCTLKVVKDKCVNVLLVKDGDKEVQYFLDDTGNKEAYHKGICPAGSEKDATVKGIVTEKDKKKTVTKPKVELTKE